MSKLTVKSVLSDQTLYEVIRKRNLSHTARWVWAFCHASRRYEGAFPSFEEIAKTGKLSDSDVQSAFAELSDKGYVKGARSHYQLVTPATGAPEEPTTHSIGASAVLTLLSEIKRRNRKLARIPAKLSSGDYVKIRHCLKKNTVEELLRLMDVFYVQRKHPATVEDFCAFTRKVTDRYKRD
jgi:DNA-binding transcriptional regulator YhcF (GntR family)